MQQATLALVIVGALLGLVAGLVVWSRDGTKKQITPGEQDAANQV